MKLRSLIVPLILVGAVVWIVRDRPSEGTRSQESRADLRAAYLDSLAAIYQAVDPWKNEENTYWLEVPWSIELDRRLVEHSSPVVLISRLIDVRRENDRIIGVFQGGGLADFRAPSGIYQLAVDNAQLAYLTQNRGRRYLESHVIVARIHSVWKPQFVMRPEVEVEEVGYVASDASEADYFVARGELLDAIVLQ